MSTRRTLRRLAAIQTAALYGFFFAQELRHLMHTPAVLNRSTESSSRSMPRLERKGFEGDSQPSYVCQTLKPRATNYFERYC
ncbi:hypothetical protein PsYK624_091130 [Phanerochaete sordida]|uniref:Uncharacterized protein n=1 Tax=Phanerochaete sordida TaxID=48140 RepID=A0A9P3GEN4_9APHY|nr:hypothetical protein PsYK624_091130 [Phanerochaete sordida]